MHRAEGAVAKSCVPAAFAGGVEHRKNAVLVGARTQQPDGKHERQASEGAPLATEVPYFALAGRGVESVIADQQHEVVRE